MGYDSCQERDFNGTDYDEAVSELLCGMPARHTAEYMLTNARMDQGDDFILDILENKSLTMFLYRLGWRNGFRSCKWHRVGNTLIRQS